MKNKIATVCNNFNIYDALLLKIKISKLQPARKIIRYSFILKLKKNSTFCCCENSAATKYLRFKNEI